MSTVCHNALPRRPPTFASGANTATVVQHPAQSRQTGAEMHILCLALWAGWAKPAYPRAILHLPHHLNGAQLPAMCRRSLCWTRVTSVSQAGASTSFGAHSIKSSTSSQTSLHSVMLNQGVVALPGEGEAALQGVHRPCSPYPMSVSWGNLNMGPFISAINPVIK